MKNKTGEENKIITSSHMLTGDSEVVNGKTQIISDGRDSDCLLDNCLDNPEQSEANILDTMLNIEVKER